MIKKLYLFAPYILFFFFSLAPFFWNNGIGTYTHLGSSDFSSAIDLPFEYQKYFFTYDPNQVAGYENTASTSTLFPYHFLMWIFSLFQIPSNTSVILFIVLILFISQVSMFDYLRYVFHKISVQKSNTLSFWSTIGAGLYAFSPYPIGLFGPGHFLNLVMYALFPLILLYYSILLDSKKTSTKNLTVLFILFFSCVSGAAYSISILYILGITLFFYSLFQVIFIHISFFHVLKRFLLIMFIMILANAWWLIPFLVTQFFTYSSYSANPLTGGVSTATEYATIGNIFLGRAEGQLYDSIRYLPYFHFPVIILFVLLAIFLGYALLKRRSHPLVLVFLGMLLLGIFLSKGTKPPFESIFQLLYEHVPGFQIFRRPINKFYWEFIFFFITLGMSGIVLLESKLKTILVTVRVLLGSIMFGIVLWLGYSFITAGGLIPFSIPDYYKEAKQILDDDKATRIFLLPGTKGTHPLFNASVNDYTGVDFIFEYWKVPIISPDPTDYSLNLPYKEVSNALMKAIVSGQSFCSEAKALGISHIVVRNDYAESVRIDTPSRTIMPFLDKSMHIKKRRVFGDEKGSIVLYSLKQECTSQLFYLDHVEKKTIFEYSFDSPVQIAVHIKGVKDQATVTYLNNYSRWWKVYLMPVTPQTPKVYFFGKEIPEMYHTKTLEYANSWSIDADFIKLNYDNTLYILHDDGIMDVKLLFYFQPQTFYIAGIFLTLISAIIILFNFIRQKKYENRN